MSKLNYYIGLRLNTSTVCDISDFRRQRNWRTLIRPILNSKNQDSLICNYVSKLLKERNL